MEKHKYPTTTLSNGLRVANFSFPHPFHFVDGSVLPACSEERCLWLSMDPDEDNSVSPCGRWTDIRIDFKLTSQVISQLVAMQKDPEIDIILAPRVLRDALCDADALPVYIDKVRTVRVSDRVKKLTHIDRFCV